MPPDQRHLQARRLSFTIRRRATSLLPSGKLQVKVVTWLDSSSSGKSSKSGGKSSKSGAQSSKSGGQSSKSES
ncbi:hypothetical protein WJX84_001225 [Apatococcus fuscideae]|uniref:Uncharacterized protein n=1 Tax=Apatococcus fuscideae TaxID=2026836 RepID=A0AAW1TKD3_9CHLO